MIGGEWKRAAGDRQSPLLVQAVSHSRWRHIGTHMFRLVAFWGRSAMDWSVPFSLGEFLVEGPVLADLQPVAGNGSFEKGRLEICKMQPASRQARLRITGLGSFACITTRGELSQQNKSRFRCADYIDTSIPSINAVMKRLPSISCTVHRECFGKESRRFRFIKRVANL